MVVKEKVRLFDFSLGFIRVKGDIRLFVWRSDRRRGGQREGWRDVDVSDSGFCLLDRKHNIVIIMRVENSAIGMGGLEKRYIPHGTWLQLLKGNLYSLCHKMTQNIDSGLRCFESKHVGQAVVQSGQNI